MKALVILGSHPLQRKATERELILYHQSGALRWGVNENAT